MYVCMHSWCLFLQFQPDSSLQPFFDSLVEQTGVKDIFSMQLCGPIDITDENENSTGGTMVCYKSIR